MKAKKTFLIIANAVWGAEGLSGGDNIFINFAKQLKKLGHKIEIFTWEDGHKMCQENGLKGVNYQLISARKFQKYGFLPLYFIRTLLGIQKAKEFVNSLKTSSKEIVIYSASDFYPDSIPSFFLKKWLPSAKWIAGFYLFAPNPLKGFRGANKKNITFPKIKNLFYWLSQKPIFQLIKTTADMICVTSDPDIQPFLKTGRDKKEIFVTKGGIDYQHLQKFQQPTKKLYQAAFVGRFHPQKGVVEMIDIWNQVVKRKPSAKLAVIGLGPMEKEMRRKIKQYKLEKNISFLGIKLGDNRNKLLQKSKIILHPAVYDSGGMAAAHGLACGLPGVSFNLPVFKTYYPQGFLHAKINNNIDFAEKIIRLLNDKRLYQKMSQEAIAEAKTWDWQQRISSFIKQINSL